MTNPINLEIERRKVKNVRLTVDRDLRVKLVAPLKYPEAGISAFVNAKSGWILKQLEYFRKRSENQIKLNPDEILFLGEPHRFQRILNLGGKCLINNHDKTISSGRNLLIKSEQDKWYINEAKKLLNERLSFFAAKYGFKYNRVFIRAQKTRWGSCSGKGNISLNWRLIKTPPEIVDYIVVHELAHTTNFNHTKEYWAKVASIYPDYKQAEKWLKSFHLG